MKRIRRLVVFTTGTTIALSACAGGSSGPADTTAANDEPTEAPTGDTTDSSTDATDPSTDATTGGDSGDAVTITFRSWSPIQQTTDQMVEAFEANNPDIKIDTTIFNYPEYIIDLQTRASSDTMPDIVGLQPGALTQQYRDFLLPLQDCAVSSWGEDWKDQFYTIGVEDALLGNPDGDENYYSLPILTQTVNLWGNSEIFADNGIEPPATWDELQAAVDKLQGNAYAPFLMPAKDAWLRNVVFMQIVNNVEPGLIYDVEDGTKPWNSPGVLTAFEYWGKVFTDGIAQQGALGLDAYPSAVNQFEAGNGAMIPLGTWWIQQSDPTKDEIAPLSQGMEGYVPFLFPTIPGGADTPQAVGGADVMLGISKNTEHPEEACRVLADWISADGGQKLINTMNDLPAYIGLTPEEFTSDKQEEMWNQFVNDWLPITNYSRYFKDPATDAAVSDALAGIAAGDLTPEEAAAQIEAAVANG